MDEKQAKIKKQEVEKKAEIEKPNEESELRNIQMLNEYKSLYDSGVISEEQFESKKKELLKL